MTEHQVGVYAFAMQCFHQKATGELRSEIADFLTGAGLGLEPDHALREGLYKVGLAPAPPIANWARVTDFDLSIDDPNGTDLLREGCTDPLAGQHGLWYTHAGRRHHASWARIIDADCGEV